MGNTRVVLTEQNDFTQYMATMPACRSLGAGREQQSAQKEDSLFYNLDNTREARPPDYPEDNTTTPNAAIAKLNGNDPNKRVGPSIILKVMAGDTIQAAVRSFYRQQATKQNNADLPAEQMLGGLVHALVAPAVQRAAVHNMRLASEARTTEPGLTANDLQSLKQRAPNNKADKPKAYLNYVFFDKQFKFVGDGSGVKQVDGEPGQIETLTSGKVVAKKDGYVYVYTSNESQQDVLFDNFGVMDISGPVLEETHYYPFGLTMSGISTTAPLRLESRKKFNGIEFNHKEFSDGSGLDLYTAKFRGLDPQIGRWWQIDPKPNYAMSPYATMENNPIRYSDLLGDTTVANTNGAIISTNGENDDFIKTTNPLPTFSFTASKYGEFYDPLYTGLSTRPMRVRHISEGVHTVTASNPCEYCLGGAGAYGPWNPDAVGMTISGNFIFGSGASLSLSFGFIGNHFGIWVTPAGGAGLDVGTGISFFAGDYIGTGSPTLNSYMGAVQSNNLNLGPFSFGQSADITQINGLNYYGTNWETGSFGIGIFSSDITILGGSSQVGYSIPLFK